MDVLVGVGVIGVHSLPSIRLTFPICETILQAQKVTKLNGLTSCTAVIPLQSKYSTEPPSSVSLTAVYSIQLQGVDVGVGVTGTSVDVGVDVGVTGTSVDVGVDVGVTGTSVDVGVGVTGTSVDVGVGDSEIVGVTVGVLVGVSVCVTDGVGVVPSLEVTVGVTVDVGVGVGVTGTSVDVGVGVTGTSVDVGVGVTGVPQQSFSYTTLIGVEPERTTNESFSTHNSNPRDTVSGYVDAVRVRSSNPPPQLIN